MIAVGVVGAFAAVLIAVRLGNGDVRPGRTDPGYQWCQVVAADPRTQSLYEPLLDSQQVDLRGAADTLQYVYSMPYDEQQTRAADIQRALDREHSGCAALGVPIS
jgi:hypothetical protein